MADNVLKGVLDAIAESDNEMAGQLVTRLREAHVHGRDDGELQTANPTRLVSPVDVFVSTDVGKEVDLLEPLVGAASGFEATYLVDTFIDTKNVTLTLLDASAPSFTDTKGVRWRFATLRVETTLDFPERDRQLRLWVGQEPEWLYYAELIQTPGAQEFRGLGQHRLTVQGSIDSAAPTTITTPGAYFSAADVGKALYVLPLATPNGNEGRQLISAVAGDFKSCTVTPGGLSTDETQAWFVIKDYDTDKGRLSGLRRPKSSPKPLDDQSPVIDGSQSFSSLDKLRRALLTDYAEAEELDRIGRNLAVNRPIGTDDETMRCLLQTLTYLPKATVYGLELVLECLFPGGAWVIYEDLVNFPNKVFILVDAMAGNTEVFEGKAFLASTGKDVTPNIDPELGGDALGRAQRERQTSATATTITIAHTPITVVDVLAEDTSTVADGTVLPSADSPAWTFQSQNTPTEGQVFSTVAVGGVTVLEQVFFPAADEHSGRYMLALPTQDYSDGSSFEMSAWFRISSFTSVSFGAKPWGMQIDDDTIDAQVGLWWTKDRCRMGEGPGSTTLPEVTLEADLDDHNQWVQVILRRETFEDKHYFTGIIGGQLVYDRVPSTVFAATAVDEIHFGYENQGGAVITATGQWKDVTAKASTPRNYYNVTRSNGVFSGADDSLTAADGPFVAGDVGKRLRIRGEGSSAAARVNMGEWNVAAYVSATEVELEGIDSAAILSVGNDNFITSLDPVFDRDVLNKEILLSGSALGNNGTRKVLEVITPKKLRVDGAAFTAEQSLVYRFNPYDGTTTGQFAAATGVAWELVDASSNVTTALTLRDSLPLANTPVEVWYTSVLSAQILRNEFVVNNGSSGAEPNIYYPFYIFDVDRATRQLLDEITAAGVLPAYEREF